MHIRQLELSGKFIQEQEKFYSEILGLKSSVDETGKLKVIAGNSTITFSESSGFIPYHFAFNIPENKFEEALDWIKDKTEVFLHEGRPEVYFKNWDAHALYFSDADGNILEFIARHTLENASDEPFGPGSILEVSEIGAPSDDLREMIMHTISVSDLQIYSRFGDNFCAIGDAHGMFIIVPEDRNWMPTDVPSKPSPFYIEYEGGNAVEPFNRNLAFDGKKFKTLEKT